MNRNIVDLEPDRQGDVGKSEQRAAAHRSPSAQHHARIQRLRLACGWSISSLCCVPDTGLGCAP
jgi:hypothetical protein